MNVAIIDYGSGNLRSAAKAFERAQGEAGLNMAVTVTRDAEWKMFVYRPFSLSWRRISTMPSLAQ